MLMGPGPPPPHRHAVLETLLKSRSPNSSFNFPNHIIVGSLMVTKDSTTNHSRVGPMVGQKTKVQLPAITDI